MYTVHSQPARPAPVSEPVTYVPPFTATCPIPNQPPIFAAEPSTNQAATVTLHLERTVTEPSLYHSMVALTAMTKSAVETYPSSLESLRDSTLRNPLNFAKGIELQATISNPVNTVSSENVMSMTTLSHLRLSPSENYPTPTAVVTPPQHFIPAACQPTCMSTSLYPVSRTSSLAESAPPRMTPATVVGLQYHTANQGQVPTKEMSAVVTSSSPQQQPVTVTTPTTVGLQSVSNKPLSSLPVLPGSRGESSDSDPYMQVDSMNTSLASRGIISCGLLPTPTPSEEDLVKVSVAELHYATTLQAQSISNVQERFLQGPQTMRPFLPPPCYTMATTPPNPTATALQMSTHQPISSLQPAQGYHGNDPHPVSSMPQVDEVAQKSRVSVVKLSEPQLPFNSSNITPRRTASCVKLPTSILSPNAKNPAQTLELDYHCTQTTSTTEGSSVQSAAVSHTSSDLPLPDSDQSVSESLPQASTTDEDSLTSINPSEAGEAFREHRDDLLIAITEPLILANSLYSKWIISRETLDEMMLVSLTNSKKNFILLDAVEARIRTNPSDFLTILAVLGHDPHLCVYAERLKNSYCEYIILTITVTVAMFHFNACPSVLYHYDTN